VIAWVLSSSSLLAYPTKPAMLSFNKTICDDDRVEIDATRYSVSLQGTKVVNKSKPRQVRPVILFGLARHPVSKLWIAQLSTAWWVKLGGLETIISSPCFPTNQASSILQNHPPLYCVAICLSFRGGQQLSIPPIHRQERYTDITHICASDKRPRAIAHYCKGFGLRSKVLLTNEVSC
jgi:hypothetical protein